MCGETTSKLSGPATSNYEGIIHLYSMWKIQKYQCMWKVHINSTFFFLRVYVDRPFIVKLSCIITALHVFFTFPFYFQCSVIRATNPGNRAFINQASNHMNIKKGDPAVVTTGHSSPHYWECTVENARLPIGKLWLFHLEHV